MTTQEDVDIFLTPIIIIVIIMINDDDVNTKVLIGNGAKTRYR